MIRKKRSAGKHRRVESNEKLLLKYQVILIAVFTAIIFTVGLVSLVDTDPTVSLSENRSLKAYPKFSLETLFDGSFFRETEEAYNDTFPRRDFFYRASKRLKEAFMLKAGGGVLVQVNDATGEAGNAVLDEGYFEYLEQQQAQQAEATPAPTPVPEVPAEPTPMPEVSAPPLDWGEFSAEGYEQFETGMILSSVLIDNNHFMQVFNGTIPNAKNYVDSMNKLRQIFPTQNIVSILAPSSCAFYSQEEYRSVNHDQRAWMELVAKNMPGIISPDVHGILQQHSEEYIYFKTDHHWTTLGAYYAYCAAMEELGYEPVDISTLQQEDIGTYMGSLNNSYSSSGLTDGPDVVYYYLPSVETEATAHYDRMDLSKTKSINVVGPVSYANKYAAFIDGDNPLTIINTSAGTGKSAILIKNSFGNAFVPWLCHNYDAVYVIDPRHVNTTVWNELWPPEFFQYVTIDDVFVCFNTLMAGTSTLTQGMMMLTVPGAFDDYLRYHGASSATVEHIRPGYVPPEESPAPAQ